MEKKTKEQFLKQEAESFPESKYGSKIKKRVLPDHWRILGRIKNQLFLRFS